MLKLISTNRRLFVIILVLVAFSVSLVLLARSAGEEKADSWQTDYAKTGPVNTYTLGDARGATSMNITVYDEGGRPRYLGWSGGNPEMEDLVEAVATASPAEGVTDETFSDLIVLYFKDGDSMALTYSRERDLLMFEDGIYRPGGDIGAIIAIGEERFD